MNAAPKMSYTMQGAAEATGLTRSRLYQAMASGELQTMKAGRQRLVSRKALETYIAKLEQGGTGRAAA